MHCSSLALSAKFAAQDEQKEKSRGFQPETSTSSHVNARSHASKKENERENNTDRGHRTRFDSYFDDGRPI
jgi:hypothetical protein